MSDDVTFTQAQLDEKLSEANGKTSAANNEAAANRVALKEMKEKLEGFTAEAEKAKLRLAEENNEFKGLYEARTTEFETLKEERERLSAENQKYQERDEKELTTLLETVPDKLKGLITEDLPLGKRLEMARTFQDQKPQPPSPRLPGGGADDATTITRQEFDILSPAAKQKHIVSGGKVTD